MSDTTSPTDDEVDAEVERLRGALDRLADKWGAEEPDDDTTAWDVYEWCIDDLHAVLRGEQ